MSRFQDIPPDAMSADQKTVFDNLVAGRGRILAPYRVWIHSPEAASKMEALGTYLNKRSHLTRREIDMAILVVASHWNSPYVMYAHIKQGMGEGLTREQLEAVRDGQTAIGLTDPREIAILELSREIVDGSKLSDERFAHFVERIGRPALAETLILLGYYTSVALAMRIHDMPVPAQ